MAITKHDIDNVSLNIVNEGYDPEEVDLLLERIADEVDSFNRALVEAASRIEAAEKRAKAAEQQAAQSAQVANSAQSGAQSAASERQIAQALIVAQKSADELRDAARVESEKAYREAEQRARDIVRDALSEKQGILEEVERLRTSTERFRSEYMALLGRFTSEAQKSMPGLESATPDVSAEKKATEDAFKVLKEGDASFGAPEAASSGKFSEASASETSTAKVQSATGADVASRSYAQPTSPVAQAAMDLDDDLDFDIEEID